MHMPKTAGTSVNHYFAHMLGRENVGWLGRNVTRRIWSRARTGRRYSDRRALHERAGHRHPGARIYATTLRDPAERIVSYHRYMMKLPEGRHPPWMTGDLLTDFAAPSGGTCQPAMQVYGNRTDCPSIFEALRKAGWRSPLDELTQLIHAMTTAMGLEPKEVPVENVAARKRPSCARTSSKISPHSRPKTRAVRRVEQHTDAVSAAHRPVTALGPPSRLRCRQSHALRPATLA